jgi:hypothetical protein
MIAVALYVVGLVALVAAIEAAWSMPRSSRREPPRMVQFDELAALRRRKGIR